MHGHPRIYLIVFSPLEGNPWRLPWRMKREGHPKRYLSDLTVTSSSFLHKKGKLKGTSTCFIHHGSIHIGTFIAIPALPPSPRQEADIINGGQRGFVFTVVAHLLMHLHYRQQRTTPPQSQVLSIQGATGQEPTMGIKEVSLLFPGSGCICQGQTSASQEDKGQ